MALHYQHRRGLLGEKSEMAFTDHARLSSKAGRRYLSTRRRRRVCRWIPISGPARRRMRAGVIRLVAGLSTRAVDRADDDYTRLVALDGPELRPRTSTGRDLTLYRPVDAASIETGELVRDHFADMVAGRPDFRSRCSPRASRASRRS
ncbi:MAG: hypothetical protein IPP18_16990 [Rhodocyclaceae bacterium]|nr:hypothetical protein [Rhodocyclaceae bacterium]